MKNIAVALNDEHLISESLKKTASFAVYGIENNSIIVKYYQSTIGISVEDKIDYLKRKKIEVLFIDDILNEELDLMNNYGLEIYINAEGAADYIVNRYLSGDLDKEYEEVEEEEMTVEPSKETPPEFIIPPQIDGNAYMPPFIPFEIGEETYKDYDNPSVDETEEYKIEDEDIK